MNNRKKYAIIAKQFGEDSVCSPKLKSITMFCKSLNLFKYFEILLRADTDRDEYRDILMSSFFCIFYSKWNVSQYQNVWLDSLWKYSVPSKANFKIHLQKSITSSPNIFFKTSKRKYSTIVNIEFCKRNFIIFSVISIHFWIETLY